MFSDLERYCRPDCILSTNTSTIDISLVGAKTRSQDRIVGAHFFSPAHVMPLLEIVRTDRTSPQVLIDTLELSSRIKKTPVVVGNCTVGHALVAAPSESNRQPPCTWPRAAKALSPFRGTPSIPSAASPTRASEPLRAGLCGQQGLLPLHHGRLPPGGSRDRSVQDRQGAALPAMPCP